jgi:hypothetical protein
VFSQELSSLTCSSKIDHTKSQSLDSLLSQDEKDQTTTLEKSPFFASESKLLSGGSESMYAIIVDCATWHDSGMGACK